MREGHVGPLVPEQASEITRSTAERGRFASQTRRTPPADDDDVRPAFQRETDRLRVVPGCQEYVIALLPELIHDLPKQSDMR